MSTGRQVFIRKPRTLTPLELARIHEMVVLSRLLVKTEPKK